MEISVATIELRSNPAREKSSILRIEIAAGWAILLVMTSRPQRLAKTLSSPFWRALPLFLLVAAAGASSGCARLKQYSVDSWQGPLPMTDIRYVESDPLLR
jgi:hypothetical protein